MKQPLTLTIAQNPYGWDLFETNTVTITDNVTIFAGPNGYGKSSLVAMMKEALKQQDYKEFHLMSRGNPFKCFAILGEEDKPVTKGFLAYDAKYDSYGNILGRQLFLQEFDIAGTMMAASEGQNKLITMGKLFDQVKEIKEKPENKDLEQIIIFVDGIDSGLSVDMIQFIMSTLPLKIQQVEDLGLECIIIFTTNNYEMCRNRTVMDPFTFKETKYESYEEFRNNMLRKSIIHNQ